MRGVGALRKARGGMRATAGGQQAAQELQDTLLDWAPQSPETQRSANEGQNHP